MNLLNKILTIVFICFLALFYFSRKKPLECRHYEYTYEAVLEEETELSKEQRIAKIQEIVGADPDGIWGNKSEAKLREYLGIEVRVQRTRQTQPVTNECRRRQDIMNDIANVHRSTRGGNIPHNTWVNIYKLLQDEYARCG